MAFAKEVADPPGRTGGKQRRLMDAGEHQVRCCPREFGVPQRDELGRAESDNADLKGSGRFGVLAHEAGG